MSTLVSIICAIFGVSALCVVSRSNGKKAQEVETIKKELERTKKEQEYANKVHVAVDNMSAADKHKWLQNNTRK